MHTRKCTHTRAPTRTCTNTNTHTCPLSSLFLCLSISMHARLCVCIVCSVCQTLEYARSTCNVNWRYAPWYPQSTVSRHILACMHSMEHRRLQACVRVMVAHHAVQAVDRAVCVSNVMHTDPEFTGHARGSSSVMYAGRGCIRAVSPPLDGQIQAVSRCKSMTQYRSNDFGEYDSVTQ